MRSGAGGSYNCELNNSTHLGHDQDFVNAKGYIYRGAEVSSYEVPLKRNEGISAVMSMPFSDCSGALTHAKRAQRSTVGKKIW